ncbi:MAG: hypothetical protein ABIH34_04700 [Nanoarchaeota archaeon]
MKKIALLMILLIAGCVNTPMPDAPIDPPDRTVGEITVNDLDRILPNQKCGVQGTEGGDPVYSLRISFSDDSDETYNRISFSVQDQDNDPINLLMVGTHPATGQMRDTIGNFLQPSSFSWMIEPDEMDITWKNIAITENIFSGEGFITIKKTIQRDCPEQVWIGGRYVIKGDPEYMCGYEDVFYPAQTIHFACEDSQIGD